LKIKGSSSTPTFSVFALINGALLNLGSSAMESCSASTLPEKMLRPRLPTFTGRPNAEPRLDSIWGRKLLTSTRNGVAMIRTIKTATTIAEIFTAGFTVIPPETGGERGGPEQG